MIDNIPGVVNTLISKRSEVEYARAYVPYQQYTKSYSPEVSLEKGTMFPELYKPYIKTNY